MNGGRWPASLALLLLTVATLSSPPPRPARAEQPAQLELYVIKGSYLKTTHGAADDGNVRVYVLVRNRTDGTRTLRSLVCRVTPHVTTLDAAVSDDGRSALPAEAPTPCEVRPPPPLRVPSGESVSISVTLPFRDPVMLLEQRSMAEALPEAVLVTGLRVDEPDRSGRHETLRLTAETEEGETVTSRAYGLVEFVHLPGLYRDDDTGVPGSGVSHGRTPAGRTILVPREPAADPESR